MAWIAKEHDAVIKTLAVVCEITGTQFSDAAKQVMVRQLGVYQARQVINALERCTLECRGRLTLADIVSRLDDGRPGPEEAWASFPKTEEAAGCVTEEMSVAWGSAFSLYRDGDRVGARMAFKESYTREVTRNRTIAEPAKWSVSPGFDKAQTESVAIEGLQRKLLSPPAALQYIRPENHDRALYLAGLGPRPLALPEAEVKRVKGLVSELIGKLDTKEPEPAPATAINNPVSFNERGEKP